MHGNVGFLGLNTPHYLSFKIIYWIAVAALTFMDGPTSGQDDLIVNVNGKKVIPSSGNYKAMEAGDIIYPEVSVDFDKGM